MATNRLLSTHLAQLRSRQKKKQQTWRKKNENNAQHPKCLGRCHSTHFCCVVKREGNKKCRYNIASHPLIIRNVIADSVHATSSTQSKHDAPAESHIYPNAIHHLFARNEIIRVCCRVTVAKWYTLIYICILVAERRPASSDVVNFNTTPFVYLDIFGLRPAWQHGSMAFRFACFAKIEIAPDCK